MVEPSRFRGWFAATALLGVVGCTSPPPSAGLAGARAVPSPATRPVGSRPADEPCGLPDEPTLDDYLRYAALNNPGLEAAFDRWKAALERIPQARALPDPRFTCRYFIEKVETRVGPQQQAASLSQMFPWFGTLTLAGGIEVEHAAAARQRYEMARLRLVYEVAQAYYEYHYLWRAIAITRENVQLLEYLEKVVRTRYKAAAAGQPDLIRVQVEWGKLRDRLAALQDFRQPLVARLNAALNRPTDEPRPWPRSAPERPMDATDEQVLAWLQQDNPELKALAHEIERRRQAVRLARTEYFPDVTLGVDYTDVGSAWRSRPQPFGSPAAQRGAVRLAQNMGDALDLYNIGRSFLPGSAPNDSGKDVWMAWLSINVPIWHQKYRAGVREAQQEYVAAARTRTDRQNVLAAEVRMALYNVRDAQRRLRLYQRQLIPLARQSLKVHEAAFRAAKAGSLDLVDAERVLLEFQLAAERARVDRAIQIARLEMLVGRRIPATADAPKR